MKNEVPEYIRNTPGIITKRTKTGTRYLLHDKDLSGRDIYATIENADSCTEKEYLKKIEAARIKLNSKKNNKSFIELVELYISARALSKNSSRNLIGALVGFSFDNDQNSSLVISLIQSDQAPGTIKLKLSCIGSFFRWIITNGKAPVGLIDPTQGKRYKADPAIRTRTLTDTEIEALFADLPSKSKVDQLVIRLAFFTGARISTICAMKPDSIRNGKIYYFNVKTGKPYKYPVPIRDTETIRIFNEIIHTVDLSTLQKQINMRINQYLRRKFGIINGESISIHSLRHTFATRAIQAGIAPDIVARLLDHSSIDMTLRVYAKHSETQLDQAIERMFK